MSTTTMQKTSAPWEWRLWWQWILANAISETVGLRTTLLIGAFLLVQTEPIIGAIPVAMLRVLAGMLIEGSVVGTAQWLVLRRPLQKMRWRAWVLATALGAGVAWTLGMIPSTLMFAAPDTGAGAPGQVSDLVIYALAAGLALAAGALLGAPQWLVLRRWQAGGCRPMRWLGCWGWW